MSSAGGQRLVSVIIPVYNAERWLPATVQSVLAQKWRDIELILVDDGSTDHSVAAIQPYLDPRVQLIRQPNQGGGVARNTGLAAAQGQFIQFLDNDDLLHPDKIARQIARLDTGPQDAIASSAWTRFYGQAPADEPFVPEAVWTDLDPMDFIVSSHLGGGMMASAGWLVPRSVADRAGGWSPIRSPNDDGEYFTRVLLASSKVLFVPDAKVYYRSGVGGYSTAQTESALRGFWMALESVAKEVLAREDTPRTRAALATTFDRFVFTVYPDPYGYAKRSAERAEALGGSTFVRPTGGLFGLTTRLLGWKAARRLQRFSYKITARRHPTRQRGAHASREGGDLQQPAAP